MNDYAPCGNGNRHILKYFLLVTMIFLLSCLTLSFSSSAANLGSGCWKETDGKYWFSIETLQEGTKEVTAEPDTFLAGTWEWIQDEDGRYCCYFGEDGYIVRSCSIGSEHIDKNGKWVNSLTEKELLDKDCYLSENSLRELLSQELSNVEAEPTKSKKPETKAIETEVTETKAENVPAELPESAKAASEETFARSGGEDAAGLEYETIAAQSGAYTKNEQESIFGAIEQNRQDSRMLSGFGQLTVTAELGEDWPGYNVTLVVYDSDNKSHDITCYEQNSYREMIQLPCGSYTVYRAFVPGDETGERYPLVTSDSKILIDNNNISTLTIRPAVKLKQARDVTEDNTTAASEKESADEQGFTDLVLAVVVFFFLIIVLAGIAYGIWLAASGTWNKDRFE